MQFWANQNSFECSPLVATRPCAVFAVWRQKTLVLAALFYGVVLKRIWLRILIVTNKYSWLNWYQRKSPDNRGLDNRGSTVLPITESVVIYSIVLLGWYCVVPENIHTPPQTEFHLGTPHLPGFSILILWGTNQISLAYHWWNLLWKVHSHEIS